MKKLICLLLPLTLTNNVHAASPEAAFQQCAVDMCGPAERLEYTKTLGIMQTPSQQNKQFLKEVLFPRLDKFMESSLLITMAKVNSFDSFISLSEKDPLNQDQQTVMKLMAILRKLGATLSKAVDPKAKKMTIDPDLLVKVTPEMDPTVTRKWAKLINAYVGHPDYETGNNMDSFTYPVLLQSIQKQQSFLPPAWVIPRYFNQLKSELNAYSLRLGTAVTSGLDLTVLDKAAAMEKLTDAEEKMVMSSLSSLFAFGALLNPEALAAAKDITMTLGEAAKMVDWQTNAEKAKKYFSSAKSIRAEKEKVFAACTVSITKFLSAAPSDLQQRKSLELLARVKEAAKISAAKYFTGEALVKALATIEKTQFTKPLSSAAVEKMILERFDRVVRKSSDFSKHVQQVQQGEAEWQSFVVLSLITGVTKEESLFGDIIEGCKDLEPQGPIDASYASLDMITMSWQSTMFPEFGAGIMAHELGHAISRAVGESSPGNETYKNTRTCVISRHRDLLSEEHKNESVDRFQEEDWADEFGTTVLIELKKTWPFVKNSGCLYLTMKDKKYTGLILQDVANTDTHSSSFLRTLVAQDKLGQLPASCLKALTPQETQSIQRSCGQ